MLCMLAASVQAQVSPKKFKKAKGIEVTYQSSYKGKVRPGEMIMKVNGTQVALESVMPKIVGPNFLAAKSYHRLLHTKWTRI